MVNKFTYTLKELNQAITERKPTNFSLSVADFIWARDCCQNGFEIIQTIYNELMDEPLDLMGKLCCQFDESTLNSINGKLSESFLEHLINLLHSRSNPVVITNRDFATYYTTFKAVLAKYNEKYKTWRKNPPQDELYDILEKMFNYVEGLVKITYISKEIEPNQQFSRLTAPVNDVFAKLMERYEKKDSYVMFIGSEKLIDQWLELTAVALSFSVHCGGMACRLGYNLQRMDLDFYITFICNCLINVEIYGTEKQYAELIPSVLKQTQLIQVDIRAKIGDVSVQDENYQTLVKVSSVIFKKAQAVLNSIISCKREYFDSAERVFTMFVNFAQFYVGEISDVGEQSCGRKAKPFKTDAIVPLMLQALCITKTISQMFAVTKSAMDFDYDKIDVFIRKVKNLEKKLMECIDKMFANTEHVQSIPVLKNATLMMAEDLFGENVASMLVPQSLESLFYRTLNLVANHGYKILYSIYKIKKDANTKWFNILKESCRLARNARNTMEELRVMQKIRRGAVAVLKAAAKRSVTPALVYHARVLATAVGRLRPSALPAARRLAASVARCLFVLKRRAGARLGAAVRHWKAALHAQKMRSGILLACAIRRLIESAELKKRRAACSLASVLKRGKLGRYAAGKRLALAARRLLERKERIEREVNQMGSQFLMDMVRSRLSDPAFRRELGKSLLHGEDVVEDVIECAFCMSDVDDSSFFVACCPEIRYLCVNCIGNHRLAPHPANNPFKAESVVIQQTVRIRGQLGF